MGLDAWIRLLRAARRVARQPRDPFFVQEVGPVDVVVREEFLVDIARGKRVLHFGFVDHPLSKEKIDGGGLLHARLARAASFLYGLDVSEEVVAAYRALTGDVLNGVFDLESDTPGPELAKGFDLILFPEVLEHLRNPGLALDKVRAIAAANGGCEVCVTVPNALAVKWLPDAVNGTELVHPDHFTYFSPYTLKHLLEASGFTEVRVTMCWHGSRRGAKAPGLTHEGVIARARPRAA